MRFFSDLHIHSRYSRATSSSLTFAELGRAAVKKGIAVIGTGDFTHPSWMGEAEEMLVEAEPGLYRLKDAAVPTRFLFTSEISTIYKQGDKVRKVHHLLGAPDRETAKRISASLARIGNILSDGRPILGITSRNLLEIVLEANEQAFLIPAHIWTPWFSVLGSKSGFDSVADCYLDLAPHIFAVETGLSSDPPMNWRVRSLDAYRLVSNSDAHSAEKLGREATVFDCAIDYPSMRTAMATGEGLLGTLEFFPEEGKYHLDGHRDCGVVLSPEETRDLSGICPVCSRPVTVGVLHRVEALADRPEGERPESARDFYSLIPLSEILGEILQVGSASKKVGEAYERLVERFAGELPLLMDADIGEIRSVAGDVLALAVGRMREGRVHREAGFDGKFGRVRVFQDTEQDLLFSKGIFGMSAKKRKKAPEGCARLAEEKAPDGLTLGKTQEQASAFGEGALMVVAGPGTGKTRVLVERIKALQGTGCASILAVTFTNRACREIAERLGDTLVEVCTFHGLAAGIMRDAGMTFEVADEGMIRRTATGRMGKGAAKWVEELLWAQSVDAVLDADQASLLEDLKARGLFTYEGLILEALRLMETGDGTRRWDHVMVDEFQDINPLQYRFLKAVSAHAASVMVIGDPNQAIYGFRGSSARAFDDFLRDNPACTRVRLADTYRLSAQVSEASNAFLGQDAVRSLRQGAPVRIVKTGSPYGFIAHEIEALAGGLSHRGVARARADYALSDIAVIVRTQVQAAFVMDALGRASIPFDAAYARPLCEIRGIRERIALLTGKAWELSVKGIGEKSLERIASGADPGDKSRQRITEARAFLGSLEGPLTSRIATIEESGIFQLPALEEGHAFYQYAGLFGGDVGRFVEFLALSSDQGTLGGEKVHVITAHAAKGLEFRCVFIAGLSRGVFPLQGSPLSEERNLFYVAMTRAAELLTLVCPETGASEFVSLLPEGPCVVMNEGAKKHRSQQMVLFD